ncbi:MAG: hypothetical protein H7A35_16330 [Planctomycetales bacterium]|nr:hypothetical protein [bacterium]UNM08394.1 MAG: hypothetical protein H7A35_16330 [Planctomycetales bacterium]
MSTRWLKVMRAEYLRELRTALRYPMEIGTGLLVMFLFFAGIFFGARQIAGGVISAENTEMLMIGYCMWFFAIIALNAMSIDVENEARQGTLEQVFICAPAFLPVLWIRALVKLSYGFFTVMLLSLMLQLVTGQWISFQLADILPGIAAIVLSIAGVTGLGLMLGALSLVLKRVGQLSSIIQFSLFIPAFYDFSKLNPQAQAWIGHFPFTRGIMLLRELTSTDSLPSGYWAQIGWLSIDAAIFAIIGSLVFSAMERLAKQDGSLAHY